MRTILLRADIVVTLDSQYNIYRPGYLVIKDGRLTEVGSQSALNEPRLDLDEVNTVDLEGLVQWDSRLGRGDGRGYGFAGGGGLVR